MQLVIFLPTFNALCKRPKIDVMERVKKLGTLKGTKQGPGNNCAPEPMFSFPKLSILALCKKKISHHIELAIHAWGTKCRRNQKLITQFALTLRDESFEPN